MIEALDGTSPGTPGEGSQERDGLAGVVRSLRLKAGLTQAELAQLSHLGIRTIRDLELGTTRRPHRDSVALLADALGLKGELREALERLAAGKPPMAIVGRRPERPGQLPPGPADFTARGTEMGRLEQLLSTESRQAVVAVISGPPGMGKTDLALHAAHRLKARYPDGQLYADLRGSERRRLESHAVLAWFLRALGVEGDAIPEEPQERGALYRTCMAERQVLVLLDDARNEVQVRPLLPGGYGCGTLVTSRNRLGSLEGAATLPLAVFDAADAVRLLERVAGRERVEADPEAAAAIAELCGCLPLAVRIAGARLADRPDWPLARMVERLADERRRLDELSIGDLDVRSSFARSYGRLDPEAQRMFRLLGLVELPEVPASAVAALAGGNLAQVERLADRLVDAQLLEGIGEDVAGHPRYRVHGLLKLFARERLEREGA